MDKTPPRVKVKNTYRNFIKNSKVIKKYWQQGRWKKAIILFYKRNDKIKLKAEKMEYDFKGNF